MSRYITHNQRGKRRGEERRGEERRREPERATPMLAFRGLAWPGLARGWRETGGDLTPVWKCASSHFYSRAFKLLPGGYLSAPTEKRKGKEEKGEQSRAEQKRRE